jgi:drug/metabolite transporter (DMT)-like permease
MAVKMQNYTIYLSSLLLATVFNCIFWPIVWFRIFVSKKITPEMRKFPMKHWLVMGLFDCIANTVTTLVSSYVSGPMNVICSQMVILANAGLSILFLGSRYNPLHIGGILIVIIGIAIDVIPLFMNGQSHDHPVWVIILILNTIPNAASNVYKYDQ